VKVRSTANLQAVTTGSKCLPSGRPPKNEMKIKKWVPAKA